MDTIVLDSTRTLNVGQAEARAMVVRFLRAQEFTLTAEQVSMVAAKRGSQITGSVQPKKLPITFRAALAPDPAGCEVRIHIGDAWRSPVGKVWGMNGPYRSLLDELSQQLDEVLQPAAAAPFSPPVSAAATRDVPLLTQANASIGKGGEVVSDKVDQILTPEGVRSTSKRLKEVVLHSSKGVISFDRMGVEGLFAVGLLVSSKPGAMPANLARDVEAFSSRVEAAVAAQPQGRVVCELVDEEIPVAEFLTKQAAIRESLPLRTLHVCTTCKLEKVVNPDYEKLREKNRRKQIVSGAVGATVSTSGVSPFILVGSLLKFKNFDIPFVCPRCQGLDADSSIVTYCPNCGERRDEAVLRSCRRCKHNFAAALAGNDAVWDAEPELDTASMPPQALLPPPHLLPSVAAVSPSTPRAFAPPVAALPPPARPPLPAPAAPLPAPAASPAPGWFADATGRHQMRYWDGHRWTEHVSNHGAVAIDPV